MYICLFHQFCALNLIPIFFWGGSGSSFLPPGTAFVEATHGLAATLHAHLGFPPGDSPPKNGGFPSRESPFPGVFPHFQVRFAVSFRVIFDNMVFVDSVELQNLSHTTNWWELLTKIGLFGYPFQMVSSCHNKKKQNVKWKQPFKSTNKKHVKQLGTPFMGTAFRRLLILWPYIRHTLRGPDSFRADSLAPDPVSPRHPWTFTPWNLNLKLLVFNFNLHEVQLQSLEV